LRSDAHLPCPSLSCSYPPPSSARRLSPQGFSFSDRGRARRGQGQKVVRSCWAHSASARGKRERERESDGGWQGRRAGEPTPSHGIAGSPRPPGASAARRAAILRRASRAGGLQCSSPLPDARAPLWFVQPHFSRFLFTYYSLSFLSLVHSIYTSMRSRKKSRLFLTHPVR
jgi:hypothetical protein